MIVEPGVVIRFMRDGVILVHGSLIIKGNSSLLITFEAYSGPSNVPYVDLLASRVNDENQPCIYFIMKSNVTSASSVENVVFINGYRTFMAIDGFMPKLNNISVSDYWFYYPIIYIIQAYNDKILLENLNFPTIYNRPNFILVVNYRQIHLRVSNVKLDGFIKLIDPWSFPSWYYNLDIICNLGLSSSYYVSSLNPKTNTVYILRPSAYLYPCRIYFNTDMDSHFTVLTNLNTAGSVVVSELNNRTLYGYSQEYLVTSYVSSTNAIILEFNASGSFIIQAFRNPNKLFDLNDFVSANSTQLFANLFQSNSSISSNLSNFSWQIKSASLYFNQSSNVSTSTTFKSNPINNKGSLNKIVGLVFFLIFPASFDLYVNVNCPNESHSVYSKITFGIYGKFQLYFKSDVVNAINNNECFLMFNFVNIASNSTNTYYPIPYNFQIQFTNFNLLSIYEENDLSDPFVNYSIADSTLFGLSIYQHGFRTYKTYNVEVANVVFDQTFITSIQPIYLSVLSLNSLIIRDCTFFKISSNSVQFAPLNIIDINTFAPDGPSYQYFYEDSSKKLSSGPKQLQFQTDAYLRKDYNSSIRIHIMNNLFLNNLGALSMIMIYQQGDTSSTDHRQFLNISNNSFINNQVYGWLIAYINQMKVKCVQMEGNILYLNSMSFQYYTPTDSPILYGVDYLMTNHTTQCNYTFGNYVQFKLSCLVSFYITNEYEMPNNFVNITRNLFLLNNIDGRSNLCFFSTFGNCQIGINSSEPINPILVNNNAFVSDTIINSTKYGPYVYPPVVYAFAEVFGLEDFLDVSLNWWNTINPAIISAKINSYALIYNYGRLFQSERDMLTSAPKLFGLQSTLCSSEWYEYENKCFFIATSLVYYPMAQQIC